jgi:hypothetical protein
VRDRVRVLWQRVRAWPYWRLHILCGRLDLFLQYWGTECWRVADEYVRSLWSWAEVARRVQWWAWSKAYDICPEMVVFPETPVVSPDVPQVAASTASVPTVATVPNLPTSFPSVEGDALRVLH